MRKSALIAAIAAALFVVPVAVYAGHQFNDVPNSHTFHNSIAWMADSGITVGCNNAGDEYCPDDPVTRAQMSAFIKRLAEFQVVDAGTLDGQEGIAYGNPVVNALAKVQVPSGATTLAEATITTPASGGLVIDAVITGSNSTSIVDVWLSIDDTTCMYANPQFASVMHGRFHRSGDSGSASISAALEIAQGTHTVTFCGVTINGTANSDVDVSLVVEYATSVTRTGSLTSS